MNSIFDKIKYAYGIKSDAELAYKLKINQSTLSMQKKRGSIDIHTIIDNCSDIDFNWLLKVDYKLTEPDSERESYKPDEKYLLNELILLRRHNEELMSEIIRLKDENEKLKDS